MEVILLCLRNSGKESQICREKGIHPSLYTGWKKKFIETDKVGLEYSSRNAQEKEIKEMKEIVAQLYLENHYLKKNGGVRR